MLRGGQPAERGFQRAVLVAVPGPILVVPAALLFSGMRGRKLLVALVSERRAQCQHGASSQSGPKRTLCAHAPTSGGTPQNSTAAYRADERRAAPRRDAP